MVGQNAPNGYGDGSQNGITVNVTPGASVTGSSTPALGFNDGIKLGSNNTINLQENSAVAGGQNGNGIRVIADNVINLAAGATVSSTGAGIGLQGNNNTVNVAAGAKVHGGIVGIGDGSANGSGVGTVIDNAGTVSGGSTSAIQVGDKFKITNSGTITTGGFGHAIASQDNFTGTVINSGKIISTASDAIGGGVLGLGSVGNLTLTNTNTISGFLDGVDAVTATIANKAGIISAEKFDAIIAGTATVTNDAGATIQGARVGINAGVLNLDNSGTVSATGANGNAAANWGIAVNGGTITNNTTGAITGLTGIETFGAGGTTTITNAGAITGTGGTAVRFAGINNLLSMLPGATLTGNAVGGATDTFELAGTGIGTFDASQIFWLRHRAQGR